MEIIKTKVSTWGNSLGLRLPVNIANSLSLESGCSVYLSLNDKNTMATITPVKKTKTYRFFSEEEIIKDMKFDDFQGDLLATPLKNEIILD